MDSPRLHLAARRHLMERYDDLCAELDKKDSEPERIAPRYNVVEMILREVERLDPDRLPGFGALAAALMLAAETARSPFTTFPQDTVGAEAIRDERARFHATVTKWISEGVPDVARLGYRRVLPDDESARWRTEVEKRWGIEELTWRPAPGENVLVLRESSMWDGPGTQWVREALRDMGGRRIIELREFGPSYARDVDLFDPRQSGPEAVWTDRGLDWIAYASHEATVAFGGELVRVLRTLWHDVDNWRPR